MIKSITSLILIFIVNISFSQYQEATITRTTGTNSVFPRQFPSMTLRKMNENEYWLFESLGTNTIFHRQFPTYIIRKDNYGKDHINQKWGVYRTTGSNSVFPAQFPDRYISGFSQKEIYSQQKNESQSYIYSNFKKDNINETKESFKESYTYSKSLRKDGKPSYNPESIE